MKVIDLLNELRSFGDAGNYYLGKPIFLNYFIKIDASSGANIYECLPIDSIDMTSDGLMLYSKLKSEKKDSIDLSKVTCPLCEHRKETSEKSYDEPYSIHEIKRNNDFVVVTCTNGDVFSIWKENLE